MLVLPKGEKKKNGLILCILEFTGKIVKRPTKGKVGSKIVATGYVKGIYDYIF